MGRKRKVIQLPRDYISYSQISLWQSDPIRYKQIYFDQRDELKFQSNALDYGKRIATSLETGTNTEDVLTDSATLMLTKYDTADKEIRTMMKTKDGWINIVGRQDTLNSVTKDFREFKTGKVPWTQKRAEQHLQLKFYAMVIYLAYGVIVKNTFLDWIETEETSEGLKPTGHIETFEVSITFKDIMETMALTAKVAKEIEIAWASHIPDPNLKW